MRNRGLGFLLSVAALIALPALCLALEEQSLLTPDGTMHVVRSGKAVDLGVEYKGVAPDNFVIEWTSRAQDGTIAMAIVPGTVSYQEKRGLQLAYDELTSKLLLLWIEEVSTFTHVRVGVLQNGKWTNSALMPTQGISRAYNPQMRVTHQTVTHLDEQDVTNSATASILSVIWWEESNVVEARYATLFLDEDSADPASLSVYELPSLVGSSSQSSYDDVPSGAYLYPALQVDGLSGGLVASFADLSDQKHKVIRLEFPSDRGKPSEMGNLKWQRRHNPMVSINLVGPVARMAPVLSHQTTDPTAGVVTTIGAGYRPTLSWRDGESLKFTRLEGEDWAPLRSIALDDTMSYEKAESLVVGMGQRN